MLRLEVLSGLSGAAIFEPEGDVVRIGRARSNHVVLSDDAVAPLHARIDILGAELFIRPIGDAPTWLERDATCQPVPTASLTLAPSDILILGDVQRGVRLRLTFEPAEVAEHVLALQPLTALPLETGSAEQNTQLLRKLSDLHAKITRAPALDPALREIADAALELIPKASHVTVVLREEEHDDERKRAGRPSGFVPACMRTRDPRTGASRDASAQEPRVRSVYARVIRERAAVMAVDAPDAGLASESLVGADIRSIIGVPLWRGDDILGVIQVDSRGSPALFDSSDLAVLGILACNASLSIANARLIEALLASDKELKKENAFLKRREQARRQDTPLLGKSRPLTELLAQIDKVADTRVSVLIQGETGTGKELVASAVHYRSARRHKLFVAQNCAALPENLLESELFGHRRGAFTGATEDRKGLFEVADGGTLFLDEVAEMPLSLQAKLLRVLQEGEVRPLGATRDKTVDVRIVAACNRALEQEVKQGRFREDLYYRLNVFPLQVPALRERRDDIPALAEHFLARFCLEIGKSVHGFSAGALELLTSYHWPGNVRELQNEVQRVALQVEAQGTIVPALLSPRVRQVEDVIVQASAQKGSLKARVEQVERFFVLEALREHGNNKTNAAKTLGMTREGLHKKLKQLKLSDT